MRICVLIDAWEPVWGGGQTHVWEISQRLVKEYHYQVDVYTRALVDDSGKHFTRNNAHLYNRFQIYRIGPAFRFFNLFGRLFWLVAVIFAVYRNQRKNQYQLLHAHAYSAAIPGKILSILLGVPIVFTVHGANYLDLQKGGVMMFIEKWLLTGIVYDCEISVSRNFLKFPNVNQRIEVIPNGIYTKPNVAKIRTAKKSPYFTLLWVGRFDKIKAVDVLLDAFKKVIEINTQVRLILVGYGYEFTRLKELTRKLNLERYVTFTGKKNRQQIIRYYAAANLFVLPSWSEGLSLTLLEAWAARLPVIVSNVGDHGLLVKNHWNGFLVAPGNSSGLAKTITYALSYKRLSRLGDNGYNLVSSKFSWDMAVKKTDQVYCSLYEKNAAH